MVTTFYQTGPNGLFIFYQVFNLILQSAKRTIIITYDYFEDAAVNGLEILVDNNFSIIDRLAIPEYESPSPDDDTIKHDNQEKSAEKQKSDRIVKWNANKIRRPITGEENNNGTSN